MASSANVPIPSPDGATSSHVGTVASSSMRAELRILILTDRFPLGGGMALACSADIALLRSHGHEVHVVEHHNSEVKEYSPRMPAGCA